MPLPFYLTCLALILFGCIAWAGRRHAWGLPAGMVLATVGVWYVGDVLYNEAGLYQVVVGEASLASAWWQVLWFVVAFGCLVYPVHRLMNGRLRGRRSHVMAYLETNRLRDREVQRRIDQLGDALLAAWLALMAIGLLRVKGDVIGLFAPYLGAKADPWARGQIGGGFSSLISLAAYLHIFVAAAFGLLAAVAFNPRTRTIALVVCALTLPYFIFDRTRNTMLATVLPGVLAYVFLRLRVGLPLKVLALLGAFLVVNFWFTFVMANRGEQAIAAAVSSGGNKEAIKTTRHEGLNMYEELAWIDYFIVTGVYLPNWGERYLAELANPIPRAIWKNKPRIGHDYAMARGQMALGPDGEVTATISTGMIGQGVVNFGRVLGPLASALLMALWAGLLARQDLQGAQPARLILYASGLILTFNMGRDITLLVVYPFLFGLGLLWIWQRTRQAGARPTRPPGGTRHHRSVGRDRRARRLPANGAERG